MSVNSGYYSEGAPSSRRRKRTSRPVYEERIVESRQGRGQPPVQQALVRRSRSDSSSSVEEIDRGFNSNSNGTYVQRRRTERDREGDKYGPPRPRSEEDYDRGRRPAARRTDSYDSFDSYESSVSRSRSRQRKRSKSRGEKALEAVGLGGAAGAIANRFRSMSRSRARSKSRTRRDSRDSSEDSYYYSRRSRSQGPGGRDPSRGRASSNSPTRKQKIEDAAKAALAAAAVEAWRSRKELPATASKRILTAALASAGIDAAVQREDRHGNRNALVSAIGGLATNRLLNGGVPSRSRSRRGDRRNSDTGTAGTAASVAALAAIAGKAIKDQRDRSRSKSRVRQRIDDDSDDDERRYSPSRRQRKSLSEHFYGPTDRVLSKMGLPDNPDNHHPKYAKDKYGRRHLSDDEDGGPRLRGGGGDSDDEDVDQANAPRLRGGGGDSSSDDCSTDSYSSDEEEKKIKKTRTKSLITGGLAAVATIHAAHSVYNSMEARESRHRKVMQGKMTPEEARRQKSRAALQDVAAVGIAALGIKGAYSEWKEVNEQRHGIKNRRLRLDEMREHRQKKIDQGLWDEEVRRKKREQHFGSDSGAGAAAAGGGAAAGAAAGEIDDRPYNDRGRSQSRPGRRGRSSSAYGGRQAIGYYSDEEEDERDRRRQRRGRSARRYEDGYDSEDEYYNKMARSRSRHRRGKSSSNMSSSNSARHPRREYVEYVSSSSLNPTNGRHSRSTADSGPTYVDGNPYGGASFREPLSSQLPPPPMDYHAASARR